MSGFFILNKRFYCSLVSELTLSARVKTSLYPSANFEKYSKLTGWNDKTLEKVLLHLDYFHTL